MSVAAQELTDADIANLAAYYSGIQVEVIPPGCSSGATTPRASTAATSSRGSAVACSEP
jgi:cytochrome c553